MSGASCGKVISALVVKSPFAVSLVAGSLVPLSDIVVLLDCLLVARGVVEFVRSAREQVSAGAVGRSCTCSRLLVAVSSGEKSPA